MQANLETIGNIERRLNISLPAEDVDSEVSTRLKKLAQTVKMHGFRPGKVPLKVVAQQYGSLPYAWQVAVFFPNPGNKVTRSN